MAPLGLDAPVPAWVGALWPVVVYLGGLVFTAGRNRQKEIDSMQQLGTVRHDIQTNAKGLGDANLRVDHLDLRLTAAETNVLNQSRVLDRIESKLDRLIEGRAK